MSDNSIKVAANMTKETFDYFRDYNLDDVVNELLERYDITMLPPTSLRKSSSRVERTINVTNEAYIMMKEHMNPRARELSLGRLLEHGYNMDVLEDFSFVDRLRESNRGMKLATASGTIAKHIKSAMSEMEKAIAVAEKQEIDSTYLHNVYEILVLCLNTM